MNLQYALDVLLILLLLAILVNAWWRWANRAFITDNESAYKGYAHIRLLRPSNLLILLGAGVWIYSGLKDPPLGSRPSIAFSTMIIGLAFVIRQWENEANRK